MTSSQHAWKIWPWRQSLQTLKNQYEHFVYQMDNKLLIFQNVIISKWWRWMHFGRGATLSALMAPGLNKMYIMLWCFMYLWMLIQNIMHRITKILVQNSDLCSILCSACNSIPALKGVCKQQIRFNFFRFYTFADSFEELITSVSKQKLPDQGTPLVCTKKTISTKAVYYFSKDFTHVLTQ